MIKNVRKNTDKIIQIAKKDKRIIAVALFGSYLKNKEYARDVDICLFLDKSYGNKEDSKILFPFYEKIDTHIFDINIFHNLPIYIRSRILKECKMIYTNRDKEDTLYDIAFSTIQEFSSYAKLYYMYLENIKNG
ncbi:hypothetical protein COU57_04140 [Candidatus Pacearchaeota archaeon CG10_big_fil_rev_8_21_14_0_10_32_14]|nr:MAG: hypothetical protein COU57_04140 [Candidatus Pacearchaeota archaeon CG10_big_fil_rev_8_21_14_0_10_32_14]